MNTNYQLPVFLIYLFLNTEYELPITRFFILLFNNSIKIISFDVAFKSLNYLISNISISCVDTAIRY